jgi:Mrp family chromosome partitioning ATPase
MMKSIAIARKPSPAAIAGASNPAGTPITAVSEEAFRLARRLSALIAPHQICLLSALGDAGLSHELASQLAIAFAVTGRGPVLLVDGNPGRPSLHQWHAAHALPGLTDVLTRFGAADAPEIASVIQPTPAPDVFLLAGGSAAGRGVTITDSLAIGTLFGRLRAEYPLVLVSSDSILGESGTGILAAQADCAAILIEAGMDQRQDLAEAANAFEALQVPVLGAIFCDTGRL